jgi:prepilin-type processing-associated H-X9-DG protein
MPKTKKRTNVKNLSKTAKNLTPAQAKRVKGGTTAHPGGINVLMADGSVRNITDGTSNTLLKQKN